MYSENNDQHVDVNYTIRNDNQIDVNGSLFLSEMTPVYYHDVNWINLSVNKSWELLHCVHVGSSGRTYLITLHS